MRPIAPLLFASITALCLSTAHADPADYLKSQLAATPSAGKFIREFPGPDTLTGVVIELPGGQKMISYLTPSGRYLISGVVIDLDKNVNLTQQYAAQYGGKQPPKPQVYTAQAVYQLGKAGRISFGNPDSQSYIAILFDPTTPLGKKLMFFLMNEASKYVNTVFYKTSRFDFIPYGKDSAALLQGSNAQRLKNLLAYAQGKPLAAPDQQALQWAKTNTEIADHLKAKPPLMVVDIPGMKEAKAISFDGANTNLPAELAQMIGMVQGGN
jgi:thiol:disulfide interchange protein DsbG